MKRFAILCLCVTLAMTLLPLPVFPWAGAEEKPAESEDETQPETTAQPKAPGSYAADAISVLDYKTGIVSQLDMRDYIIGAVAAEMPASYHEEALKAQALTCYTYAIRKMREEEKKPTPSLKGAHVSTDIRVHQAYMSVEEMHTRWGDDFTEYYDKVAACVDAVAGLMIVYNNEPIVAVFHAISPGKTESAATLWGGGGYPYLVSTDSEGDTLASQFSTTAIFTEKQFAEIVEDIDGVELGSNAAKWVTDTTRSDSGTVLTMKIGGKSLTGAEVRTYFSLRSPNFTLDYDDGTFTFHVSGYGHGVGMSQYGADYMARQGATYEEIIKHYYKDVEIQ